MGIIDGSGQVKSRHHYILFKDGVDGINKFVPFIYSDSIKRHANTADSQHDMLNGVNWLKKANHRMINKKELSERDICTKFINPALEQAGWDMQKQVREEVGFTDGRVYVKGNLSVRAYGANIRTSCMILLSNNITDNLFV